MSKNNESIGNILVAAPTVIVGIGVSIYACTFAKNGTSNDPAVWGQFGDYINFWVSIASLVVVAILTYNIHKIEQDRAEEQERINQKRDVEQKNFASSLEKPILTFIDIGSKWECANMGRGAALNIIIAHAKSKDELDESVKCYSLESGGKFTITWRRETYMWISYYNDVFDNYYSSICEDDNTFFEQNIDESLFALVNKEHKRLGDMKNIFESGK